MNCRPENYLDFIEARLRDWADVARNTNEEWVRARAQKNLANLIRRHPELALELGCNEETLTTK